MKKIIKLTFMLGGCFMALASCNDNSLDSSKPNSQLTPTTTSTVVTTPGSTVVTSAPTSAPTTSPTVSSTTTPTTTSTAPTGAPTTAPTVAPTSVPTTKPTTTPTSAPTTKPTTAPTSAPTTTGPVVLKETEVYIVGDSTVSSFTDSYYYPRYGYGTQLSSYFDSKATFINYALSGRSSRSFIEEANYSLLKSGLSEGDYLIVGFGHNDEKSDDAERFTDASKDITDSTSFKYYLNEYYVKLAKEKGATPIICTPIVRANSSNDYTGSSAHITSTGNYSQAIIELGQEVNCDVVDLTTITKNKYTELGYDEAKYYHAMTSAKYDTDGVTVIPDTNTVDNTHLNIYGAKFVAYSFANALKNTKNELGNYVLGDIAAQTKENDLVSNPNYVVPS